MRSGFKVVLATVAAAQWTVHAAPSSRSYSGSASSKSYGSSGSSYKPSTSYGSGSSYKPSTSYGGGSSYKPSTSYGGGSSYKPSAPTYKPSYNYGGTSGTSTSTPKPSAPSYKPSYNYGGTSGTSTSSPKPSAPSKPSYSSTGGSVSGRVGGSPQPYTPPPVLKSAPVPATARTERPISTGYNPYAPFNGGQTSRAKVEEKRNADGTITKRYYDDSGIRRETQVVNPRTNTVVQSSKKDNEGTVIHSYGSGSVKITPSASGGQRKEFSDGRRVTTSKVVDPRTKVETIRKESVAPDGRRVVRESQYRPIENWSPGGSSTPSTVYVTRHDGLMDNPFFWLWMFQNNSNNAHAGGYAPAPSQPSAPAPAPAIITEKWQNEFSNLPEKYHGTRKYTDTLDWVTDHVMLSIGAENVPARGWFATHFCFFWCADTSKDYDLPVAIRDDLKKQIGSTLESMRSKQDIPLYKFMTEKGLDEKAKHYMLIASDDLEVREIADQEDCTLGSGAVITLQEYNHETGLVVANVISQPKGGDMCDTSVKIQIKAKDVQIFQNEFLEKLDNAIQTGLKHQKKRGASLVVPQVIETI